MIYVFSSKNAAAIKRALGTGIKGSWIEILPEPPKKQNFNPGDQLYLDASGISQAELKKAIALFKKSGTFWGIIDPRGTSPDPSSFFFNGAHDYIGSGLVKKGLNKKRFFEAFSWAGSRQLPDGAKPAGKGAAKNASGKVQAAKAGTAKKKEPTKKKETSKLSSGKFEGWKSIRSGQTSSFFFLYASISEKLNLRSQIGENYFMITKSRLRDIFQVYLRDADALLWMETEDNSLYLIPPRADNLREAIEAVLKILLNCRIIGIEKLGLSIPLEFTFALHYGDTVFQGPGKTGAVISEPVNYIFHLGMKRAESERLTISDDVPKEVIPKGLLDLFKPAGVFEGIPVSHSRRFLNQ